ncbi:class I SAM-dependent methyltransferase [Streptomyces rugosispiralis]|uniref:Class I SAM-dependent methyltransferase n=1 Tax=Streptomyces rugosispiralis TaxID=2967341 RepID=A0ABT1V3H9_9ACTN|nr:class I SAM-dependent methyltransferase [Streptomyces rugosispiralis]MCQ8191593.1 class I SAM-dependent methyltransferase [Streptomyces rugosispiralis]
MKTTDVPRYTPDWLELRESADAAARSPELLEALAPQLAGPPLVIHDLGCGTGSMGRWLAPRLSGPQLWILHDRDPELLDRAAVRMPRAATDGSRITIATRRGDLSRLTASTLDGASLVTASALLDVLTPEEVDGIAAACAEAECPALLALSVVGRVELAPADPMDAEITEAFNAHQRRGGLVGPDAMAVASEAFARHGATVRTHASPWVLGAEHSALTAEWLRGWVGAAVEHRPELGAHAEAYLRRRLAIAAAGALRVVVHHHDLLALPAPRTLGAAA